MHGALEFMPGKQAGLSGDCWPDRLIGNLPNIYLYAANNPSEATLAKRRSNAITVTHLTPPLARAGLYKGLVDLKDTLTRLRGLAPDAVERGEMELLVREQAEALDLTGDTDALWLKLLETEGALITDGLHVLGKTPDAATLAELCPCCPRTPARTAARHLMADDEMQGLLRALSARFIAPVPGGDLIRSPAILPTGRNIHAFDPFRMPTAFALADGAAQAQRLLDAHPRLPQSVALVLWGGQHQVGRRPDCSGLGADGGDPSVRSLRQAFGRGPDPAVTAWPPADRRGDDPVRHLPRPSAPADPDAGRSRLEMRHADEPLQQNFVRAHALAYADEMNVRLETAALRVFSNAEGHLWRERQHAGRIVGLWRRRRTGRCLRGRKGFAYGMNGKAVKVPQLLQTALRDVDLAYQNLESVELGVTSVDHYFDTLGGIARAVRRARGGEDDAGLHRRPDAGGGTVRTLQDQIALESRSRT
jgi:magnesium chelatase subunit H